MSGGTHQGGDRVGRYVIYEAIATGGMASVHFGRMLGPAGFTRLVAVKRLLPHLARDPGFVTSFLDEARLASRIAHPNVVATLDVVAEQSEIFLVMDYVRGESLAALLRAQRVPTAVLSAAMAGMLHGLHAAHEARGDVGERLHIVHRDVSPQNVMLGDDGVPRLVDFGIAKAAWRRGKTQPGGLKGKLSYLSPEQVRREPLDRRTDLYAAGVVLWEALTGRPLFASAAPHVVLEEILNREVEAPSAHRPETPPELDALVLRALAKKPAERFATAAEMAHALEHAAPPASQGTVAAWVRANAGEVIARRARRIAEIEAMPQPPAGVEPAALEPALLPPEMADLPTAPRAAVPASLATAPTPLPARAVDAPRPPSRVAYQLSATWIRGFSKVIEQKGLRETFYAQAEPQVQRALDSPGDQVWWPLAVGQGFANLIGGLEARLAEELGHEVARQSIGPIIGPLVKVVLAVSGQNPQVLLSRFEQIVSSSLRGLSLEFTPDGPKGGRVTIGYPFRVEQGTYHLWCGNLRFAISLAGRQPRFAPPSWLPAHDGFAFTLGWD